MEVKRQKDRELNWNKRLRDETCQDQFNKIGQQLESGVKIIKPCSNKIFVFATFWPSWYFAAQEHGFTTVCIHVEDMAKDTVHVLEELLKGGGSELRTKEDWLRELQVELQNDGQEMVIVLLQGPMKTLEGLRLLFRNMSMEWNTRVLLVEVLTHKVGALEDEYRNKRRRYDSGAGTDGESTSLWISHEMVGGVVGEKWKVRINKLLNEQVIQEVQRQTEVMAQAADYLSTIERGNTIKPPTMGQEIKVLWKQRTVWVCANKNVFSSTGWVRRLATVRELMAMYDMGESEIRVVSKRILERNSTFTEFTQQVPAGKGFVTFAKSTGKEQKSV